jgi:hypothetical protein
MYTASLNYQRSVVWAHRACGIAEDGVSRRFAFLLSFTKKLFQPSDGYPSWIP